MVIIASSSFHPAVAGGFPLLAPPRAPGTAAAAGSAAFTCDHPGPALPAPADAAPRAPPASEALVPRRAPVRLHLCGSGCPARSFPPQSRAVRALLPGALVALRDAPLQATAAANVPRRGSDTVSKMAPGSRARAFPGASPREGGSGPLPRAARAASAFRLLVP